MHYVFEPDSFVPLLQASSQSDIRKMFLKRPEQVTTEYIDEDGNYDIDRDPLYNAYFEPGDISAVAMVLHSWSTSTITSATTWARRWS